ncbi:hypothetical protein L4C33_13970 [Vibrio makurazakiensis]|uniref:hypothetical protein n=1 Tax=Vibrio makurazakiensis TaxID=2910250 RepID=UPI003D0B7DD1
MKSQRYDSNIKFGSSVLALSFITACGGGDGGGDGGTTGTSTPSVPSTTQAVATEAGPSRMEELVVPDGFDYNPVTKFEMSLDISDITTQRAFVSVYSRFTERANSTLKPDYSSKVIASSLTDGKIDLTFPAPNVHEQLLVEIWFYDGQDPMQKTFSTANNTITW